MYFVYKCSTCRRQLSREANNTAPFVDLCTITNGCEGRLIRTRQSATHITENLNSDVERWQPRSHTSKTSTAQLMSSSEDGSIAFAVSADLFTHVNPAYANPPTSIDATFSTSTLSGVQSTVYTFTPSTQRISFSGRDSTGKTMLIPTSALSGSTLKPTMAYVSVDGVPAQVVSASTSAITLANNTATAGKRVMVVVYSAPTIEYKTVPLTLMRSSRSGAFSNVDIVVKEEAQRTTQGGLTVATLSAEKFFVYKSGPNPLPDGSAYTLESVGGLNGDKVALLMASPPFENKDRIADKMVFANKLKATGCVVPLATAGVVYLEYKGDLATSVFPPLRFYGTAKDGYAAGETPPELLPVVDLDLGKMSPLV